MGWSLDDNIKVDMVKQTLAMAHKNCIHARPYIIHHSDRGKHYCCPDYTHFVNKMGFIMSTTQQSDPYENAIAERMNGIIKHKFALKNILPSLDVAK